MIKSHNITTWELHDPTLTNDIYMTVAMYAAIYKHIKDLPKELYHDPLITDEDGCTVAMIAAMYGCI